MNDKMELLSDSDLSKYRKQEENYFGEQYTIYKRFKGSEMNGNVMGKMVNGCQIGGGNVNNYSNNINNYSNNINNSNNKKSLYINYSNNNNENNDNTTIFDNNNNNTNNNNEYQQ